MRRELTWQAVVSAVLVSALVSASYPYVVLKLGMGPNVSVVSAFLGAVLLLVLAPRTHGQNRWMNNIVQTAGTSAAMTAFMCVIAAAVEMAAKNPAMTPEKLNGITTIAPWPMFWWLLFAGGIGVLFMVLFRRHFIDDPKMVFADGVAAAETVVVLDSRGPEARRKMGVLGLTALASAVLDWFREVWEWVPNLYPTPLLRSYRVGMEWSLLNVGSGLLIGLNVSLSLLAATAVFQATGPILFRQGIVREMLVRSFNADDRSRADPLLDQPWDELSKEDQGFIAERGGRPVLSYMKHDYYPILLLWFMWPATALMITSAITAVLLKWRAIVDSFRHLRVSADQRGGEDMSLRTVVVGGILFTVGLAVVQRQNFGMSYLQTAVAVACSLPLILVGVRVLGETNNGPISVMMNGLQAVFAVFWPGATGHNLIAAGMAGSCNSQGQGTIQDYKTGKLIGSTPRILTWVQLAAVPIGAAAVAIMYPLLKRQYGEVGDKLSAPTAIKIANMAVLLSQGLDALPRGALLWTVIAAMVGILLPVIQHYRRVEWLPSAAGFGFGLILPGTLNVSMALGGILGWVWARQHPASYDRYAVTVASGFIAGEALLGGLAVPIISWFWPHLLAP
jgi:uncharacterized oligopeptide transporter (OPT) family protein